LSDGYLGSGSAIRSAIKKYGKQNFSREIIKHFGSKEEMYEYEKAFINEDVVGDKSTYNQTIGGRGGFSHIDNYGDNNPMKKPEVAYRCVEATRKNGGYETEKRIISRANNLLRAKEKNIGRKRPEHSKIMKEWAKGYWKENKEKMRDALSSSYCLICPNGVQYKTNRLEDFCRVNDLPYTTIWTISVTGKSPSKGKAKGWLCEKEKP
jgi:hypothetical protein